MGFCLFILVSHYIFSTKDCDIETDWNLSIILIFLYACSYSIGWGPVVMLVYTEIIHFDVSIEYVSEIKFPTYSSFLNDFVVTIEMYYVYIRTRTRLNININFFMFNQIIYFVTLVTHRYTTCLTHCKTI